MARRTFLAVACVGAVAGLAGPTGSRGAGPPPPVTATIVLNRSIGGVTFHERKLSVERRLGRGVVVRPGRYVMDIAYPRYALTVSYDYFPQKYFVVIGVETESPRYRTKQGVHVGSPMKAVRAITGMLCTSKTRCDFLPKKRCGSGTAFQFDAHGRVNWIAVGTGCL